MNVDWVDVEEPVELKVCGGCGKTAEPSQTNGYGNLGGWLYRAGQWFCRSCPK